MASSAGLWVGLIGVFLGLLLLVTLMSTMKTKSNLASVFIVLAVLGLLALGIYLSILMVNYYAINDTYGDIHSNLI